MMNFGSENRVLLLGRHQPGQHLIQVKEEVDSYAIVRCIEERGFIGLTKAFYFRFVLKPARGTTHHF
ncbi:hypothetical protein D9M69_566970 [compost metagenome]